MRPQFWEEVLHQHKCMEARSRRGEDAYLDGRVAAIYPQKSRYMDRRVLRLTYVVWHLRIIDDVFWVLLMG